MFGPPEKLLLRQFEFAPVAFHLTLERSRVKTVHLVMDSLNMQRRKSLTEIYGKELGAEIEIGILSRQCLGNRRIPDLKRLRRGVRAWNRRMKRAMTNWKRDSKAARRKFGYKEQSFYRAKN